jgi:acylphosphatase
MKKSAEIYVSGKVQGVFFRVNAESQARDLGLTGFVQNMADGQVLLVAEGEEETLKNFVEWLKIGPELASVEKISVKYGNFSGEFQSFEIK